MRISSSFVAMFSAVALVLVSATPLPKVKSEGSRFTFYDGKGVAFFRITTRSVKSEQQRIHFGSPQGELFTGGKPVEIEAEEAVYEETAQTVSFNGAVKGTQKDLGLQFSAESISFSLETRQASSEKEIDILYGPFSIRGKGFIMDVQGRRLEVRGEVKGGLAEAD